MTSAPPGRSPVNGRVPGLLAVSGSRTIRYVAGAARWQGSAVSFDLREEPPPPSAVGPRRRLPHTRWSRPSGTCRPRGSQDVSEEAARWWAPTSDEIGVLLAWVEPDEDANQVMNVSSRTRFVCAAGLYEGVEIVE